MESSPAGAARGDSTTDCEAAFRGSRMAAVLMTLRGSEEVVFERGGGYSITTESSLLMDTRLAGDGDDLASDGFSSSVASAPKEVSMVAVSALNEVSMIAVSRPIEASMLAISSDSEALPLLRDDLAPGPADLHTLVSSLCQLSASSTPMNCFKRSRYCPYSSTSLWPAPSTQRGSTVRGHRS